MDTLDCGEVSCEYCSKDKCIYMTNKIDVLDKIRAEIKEKFEGCDICEWFDDYDYEENDISEYRPVGSIDMVLDIIDKYKAESEGVNADND